jgi:hypothetical protein
LTLVDFENVYALVEKESAVKELDLERKPIITPQSVVRQKANCPVLVV